ncbi:hypothetical protein HDF11_005225 [Tunturiibacter psychrotolerans]
MFSFGWPLEAENDSEYGTYRDRNEIHSLGSAPTGSAFFSNDFIAAASCDFSTASF